MKPAQQRRLVDQRSEDEECPIVLTANAAQYGTRGLDCPLPSGGRLLVGRHKSGMSDENSWTPIQEWETHSEASRSTQVVQHLSSKAENDNHNHNPHYLTGQRLGARIESRGDQESHLEAQLSERIESEASDCDDDDLGNFHNYRIDTRPSDSDDESYGALKLLNEHHFEERSEDGDAPERQRTISLKSSSSESVSFENYMSSRQRESESLQRSQEEGLEILYDKYILDQRPSDEQMEGKPDQKSPDMLVVTALQEKVAQGLAREDLLRQELAEAFNLAKKAEERSVEMESQMQKGNHHHRDILEKSQSRIKMLETKRNQEESAVVADLQRQVGDSLTREDLLRQELAEKTKTVKQAEAQRIVLDLDNMEAKKTIEQYHDKVSVLEDELRKLDEKERKVRQEKKIHQNRGTQQRIKIAGLEHQLDESRARESELNRKVEAMEAEQAATRNKTLEEGKATEEDILALRAELDAAQSRVDALMKENKALQEESSSIERKAQKKSSIPDQLGENEAQHMATLERDLDESRARESLLRKELENAKAENVSVRNDIQEDQKKQLQLVANDTVLIAKPHAHAEQFAGKPRGIMGSLGQAFFSAGGVEEQYEMQLPLVEEAKLQTNRTDQAVEDNTKTLCFVVFFYLLWQLRETENLKKEAEVLLELYEEQLQTSRSRTWTLEQQNKEQEEIIINMDEMKSLLNGQKDLMQRRMVQQAKSLSNLECQLEEAGGREEMLQKYLVHTKDECRKLRRELEALELKAEDSEEKLKLNQCDLEIALERIKTLEAEVEDYLLVVRYYEVELREEQDNILKKTELQRQHLCNLEVQLEDTESREVLLIKELAAAKDETSATNLTLKEVEESLKKQLAELHSSKKRDSKRIEGLELKIEELQSAAQNLTKELEDQIRAREGIEDESKQRELLHTKELADAKTDVKCANNKLQDFEAKIKQMEHSLSLQQRECERIGELEIEIDELQRAIRSVVIEREQLIADQKSIEDAGEQREQSLSNELAATKEEAKSVDHKLKEAEESLKQMEHSLSASKQGDSKRIHDLELKINELQGVIRNLEEEKEDLIRHREALAVEAEQGRKTLSSLETQWEETGVKIGSLREEFRRELAESAKKTQKSIEAHKKDLDVANNHINILVHDKEELQAQLEREQANAETKIHEENQKLVSAHKIRKEAEEQAKHVELSLKLHQDDLEIARECISVLEKETAELRAVVQRLHHERALLRTEKESLLCQAEKRKMTMSSLESQLELRNVMTPEPGLKQVSVRQTPHQDRRIAREEASLGTVTSIQSMPSDVSKDAVQFGIDMADSLMSNRRHRSHIVPKIILEGPSDSMESA